MKQSNMKQSRSASIKEKYRCKRFLETIDDEDALMSAKTKLCGIYLLKEWNVEEIVILMKDCFPLQRKLIAEEKCSINQMKEQFPFLFVSTHFKVHFETLIGLNLDSIYKTQEKQIPELVRYLNYKSEANSSPHQYLEGLAKYFEDLQQIIRIFQVR